MKNISTALKTHISGEVTTLATCWRITRRDGAVLGFTDFNSDLTVSGVVYEAQTGFTPTAVQSTSGFSVDNLDVDGMLDSAVITESDINAGLYDFAEISVFMVNYTDLTQGILTLRTGWLGEVSFSQNHFIAEMRGLAQALNQNIGDVFSANCRALFGDARCKVDLSGYTFTGVVSAVNNNRVFVASDLSNVSGYFNYGLVKFTSGANNGISMEVKDYIEGGDINLSLPLPYAIEVGDEFQIVAGCDKTFATCVNNFDNALNFRGEPHVPGMDKILETAGTFS